MELTVRPESEPVIADRPLHIDPAKSFTLPARYYTDGAVAAAETAAIFERSWIYVGHRSQVAAPGQYLTATVGSQDVIVLRDESGEVGAFHNVCKHRGHQLLEGAGSTRLITCPYHAWVYGLDGTLRQARNTAQMVDFDACDFALTAVQVEDFCGFLFVNLDPGAVPLAQQAAGLEAELREFCPEIDDVVFVQRDTYDVASNWKTMVDNFLECYHCAPAHRDFVDLVDMSSYRSEVHGIWSSHISRAVRSTDSAAFSIEPGTAEFGYGGWFLWPNLTFWVYPGDAQVSVLQMNPGGTERTVEYQDWFCPTGEPTAQLRDAMVYQKDVLQPEDIGLCESVQRGLRSHGYNQGRFVIDNDRSELSEHAVHHFQMLVADALGLEVQR